MPENIANSTTNKTPIGQSKTETFRFFCIKVAFKCCVAAKVAKIGAENRYEIKTKASRHPDPTS